MNELKRLRIEAEKALKKIEEGKTFSFQYVLDRFNKAADNNPRDVLICTAREMFWKKSIKL